MSPRQPRNPSPVHVKSGSKTLNNDQAEDRLLESPIADLRDHMDKNMSAHQITLHCCCDLLIAAMLSDCCCGPHTSNQSVFERLFEAHAPKQTKRRRSRKKSAISDEEYSQITVNMTWCDSWKTIIDPEKSDAEFDGVYQHTRSRIGTILSIDYKALLWGLDASKAKLCHRRISSVSLIRRKKFFCIDGRHS